MRKTLSLLIIFFFTLVTDNYSQNIVPNWSFETVTGCDSLSIGYGNAPPWDRPNNGSPDLFNSCAIFPADQQDVPSNGFGYQYPHFGNGYAGFVSYELGGNSFREYIQVHLDSILITQHKYCINFYVSLSKALASNNIGMYFSPTHTFVAGSNRLNLIPQILVSNIISDTTNWTLISGEYIAAGGEQYIIIGNFNTAATTSAFSVSGGSTSYYFVDDVSIWDCTGSGLGVDEISNNNILISPNPTSGLFTLSAEGRKIKEIKVTNLLGQEIITTTNPTVNLTSQPNGIYFVKVETDGSPGSPQGNGITTKKVVKQ